MILAAGKGTRMKSDKAKVLHEINGRPMVEYVLDKAWEVSGKPPVVVVGHQAQAVEAVVGGRGRCVLQSPQLGTGHAVMMGAPLFENSGGTLVVLYGDVPLLTSETIQGLIAAHNTGGHAATILSAVLDDPTGYGRIVRTPEGNLDRIVEHKDASEAIRAIAEINTGLCCFDIPALVPALKQLRNDNSQGEYYITDVPGIFNAAGLTCGVTIARDPLETEGINTLEQLARAQEIMNSRK